MINHIIQLKLNKICFKAKRKKKMEEIMLEMGHKASKQAWAGRL